jgi:hypothetical protein
MFDFLDELVQGRLVNAFDSELGGLLWVAPCPGNNELFNPLSTTDDGGLEASTACLRLTKNSVTSVPIEIEFAASHFYEIDISRLKQVDLSIRERLLSSKSLRLSREDSLLDFIICLESDCPLFLLRYLRTEYLSGDGMELFLEHFCESIVDPLVWESFCRRLRLAVPPGSLKNSSIGASRFVRRWGCSTEILARRGTSEDIQMSSAMTWGGRLAVRRGATRASRRLSDSDYEDPL